MGPADGIDGIDGIERLDRVDRPDRVDRVDVIGVVVPMVGEWTSASASMSVRRSTLVCVHAGDEVGWGECVALESVGYSAEWTDGARLVLISELVPALLAGEPDQYVDLHPMASTAVEAAVIDLRLRREGTSLAAHLGAAATSVPAGIVIGLQPDVASLLTAVGDAVDAGYARVKVKVEPASCVDWMEAVRRDHPSLDLWVDANGAFDPADAAHRRSLERLDDLGFGLIEQPFAADAFDAHIDLARSLATPLCLDEPLVSLEATRRAVEMGACSVVNLKPARVGGWQAAAEILRWCGEHEVDVWLGGMIETGIGRAANLAFAAHPAVTMTGDVSPSTRFFADDVLRSPIEMVDGRINVPTGPGIGVEVDRDRVEQFTETFVSLTA